MDLFRIFSGKKFMWDGKEYAKEEAEKFARDYEGAGFEVQVIEEGGKYFVFTRREVKEVKVEGAPPY
jgi:hypothetical protein